MKKKYVLGSIVCVLLMLVSTQMVFMENVKSDPTIHYGDAFVGELWVTELDVSSVLQEFEYIGIAHARADHDWVAWELGSGNISANWTVDIESESHPEYYIIYSLIVYNINNNSQEIGNATFSKTYEKDERYRESGTLTIPIEFSESEMSKWDEVTLVCYLGAIIQINNTIEAENFTSVAEDRSVVAVDFEMPLFVPTFSHYLAQANKEAPSMWSWIDGWEEHFDTEYEMLNEQTFFIVGEDETLNSQPQINDTWWHLGNLSIEVINNGFLIRKNSFNPGNTIVNWSINDPPYIKGLAYARFHIDSPKQYSGSIYLRVHLRAIERNPPLGYPITDFSEEGKKWTFNEQEPVNLLVPVRCHERNDNDGDRNITVGGFIWARRYISITPVQLSDYKIFIDENVSQDAPEFDSTSYYWDGACAFQNFTSETLEVQRSLYFGITIVKADIRAALRGDNQSIYSFAADRGDVRVEFTLLE